MAAETSTNEACARIEDFFERDVLAFTNILREIDERLGPDAVPAQDAVLAEIDAAYDAINAACKNLEESLSDEPDILKETQERYRTAIAPWEDKSWFMRTAKTKPRGYAGDFEMLEGVYAGKPKSDGLGGYLCLQGYNTTLARGVIARMETARDFLCSELKKRADESIHILNVACGPCRELFEDELRFAKDLDLQITLVDQEQEALDFVEQKVQAIGKEFFPQIQFRQHNALRMRRGKANIEAFGAADILYSVGLCDYLPDKLLIPMLTGWRETLKPGGSMYVAFKDQYKYDKTIYQWMTDWYFLQRTTEECRELFIKAGFADHEITMTRDSETESIITFCGRVPAAKSLRMDSAHQLSGPNPANKTTQV